MGNTVYAFSTKLHCLKEISGPGSSVGCDSTWYVDGRGFDPRARQNIIVVMKSFLRAFLSLTLTRVGQLSVTGKRMCTKNWLTAYLSLSGKGVVLG